MHKSFAGCCRMQVSPLPDAAGCEPSPLPEAAGCKEKICQMPVESLPPPPLAFYGSDNKGPRVQIKFYNTHKMFGPFFVRLRGHGRDWFISRPFFALCKCSTSLGTWGIRASSKWWAPVISVGLLMVDGVEEVHRDTSCPR